MSPESKNAFVTVARCYSLVQMALWLGIASFVIISIVLKSTPPA